MHYNYKPRRGGGLTTSVAPAQMAARALALGLYVIPEYAPKNHVASVDPLSVHTWRPCNGERGAFVRCTTL